MASRAATLTLMILLVDAAASAAQRTPVALHADAAASRIYVVTHRTGLLKFLGHEHAILAQKWSADLCWDEGTHAATRAAFVIDARSLDIDADSARALAGIGKGPSPQQRAQIYAQLHDEKNLATTRFPELRFESTAVTGGGAGRLRIGGRLTIRGVTKEVELPVSVEQRADELWFTGSLSFRQSQFGISPESIAGVVKVSDLVDLHIRLASKPGSSGC